MSCCSADIESLLSHKIGRDELRAGDHIYSYRKFSIYSHHGIYVGDEKVIHFTTGGVSAGIGSIMKSSSASRRPCPKCGDGVRPSGVTSSCLDCFLKKGKLRRYRYGVSTADFVIKVRGGCSTAPSDPPENVIYRAEYLLENNGFGKYNLRKNNCEDFALYCMTEITRKSSKSPGCSSQTKSVGAFFSSLFKKRARYIFNFCLSRMKNDIGKRADVRKIPVEQLCAQRAKGVDSDCEE